MSLNFTAADRVGGIGGYIGGIATLLGLANDGDIRISYDTKRHKSIGKIRQN